jgi:hypothetical protein
MVINKQLKHDIVPILGTVAAKNNETDHTRSSFR